MVINCRVHRSNNEDELEATMNLSGFVLNCVISEAGFEKGKEEERLAGLICQLWLRVAQRSPGCALELSGHGGRAGAAACGVADLQTFA